LRWPPRARGQSSLVPSGGGRRLTRRWRVPPGKSRREMSRDWGFMLDSCVCVCLCVWTFHTLGVLCGDGCSNSFGRDQVHTLGGRLGDEHSLYVYISYRGWNDILSPLAYIVLWLLLEINGSEYCSYDVKDECNVCFFIREQLFIVQLNPL